jgi:hypothetical protein
MTAVKKHGWALQYASAGLLNDKEVVLMPHYSHLGLAFQYISNKLRNDYNITKELFILAIKTFYNSDEYKYDNDKVLYNYVLCEKLKEELDYIKLLYNYDSYKQVCEYIKRTDEIKKFSYRIPMLDTKFRFI